MRIKMEKQAGRFRENELDGPSPRICLNERLVRKDLRVFVYLNNIGLFFVASSSQHIPDRYDIYYLHIVLCVPSP